MDPRTPSGAAGRQDERDVDDLAAEFVGAVEAALSPAALEQVRLRNRGRDPAGAGSCATHDFVDANELMADAWSSTFSCGLDPDDAGHVELVSRAWDLGRWAALTASEAEAARGAVLAPAPLLRAAAALDAAARAGCGRVELALDELGALRAAIWLREGR